MLNAAGAGPYVELLKPIDRAVFLGQMQRCSLKGLGILIHESHVMRYMLIQ